MGPAVLIVFDTHAPPAPPAFISFIDAVLADGRIVVTRVWIGQHIEIPTIPDAIFVPVLNDAVARKAQEVFELFGRLPGRGAHQGWAGMNAHDWTALVKATTESQLGIVLSDIGEQSWTLFWHKIGDSRAEGHGVMIKRGFTWMRTGMAIVEKHHGAVA